jgi:hypothetical protein
VGTPTDPRRTHEARRDSFAGGATPELPIGHSRSRRRPALYQLRTAGRAAWSPSGMKLSAEVTLAMPIHGTGPGKVHPKVRRIFRLQGGFA